MSGLETVTVEKVALQILLAAGRAVLRMAPLTAQGNANELLNLRRAIALAEQACGAPVTPREVTS